MRLRTEFGRLPALAAAACIFTGAMLQCACSDSSLPPVPDPNLDGFALTVRDQIRSATERARAEPDSTAAVGALGRVLYAYGQNQAAAACFERCQRLEPQEFEWSYLLAVARSDLGQTDAALLAFEAAAAVRPNDLPTAIRRADLLELSGERSAAAGALRQALQLAPESAAVHYRLGRLAAAESDGGAIQHFEAALAIDTDYREAIYALAQELRLAGREAEAASQLERYESMAPNLRRHYEDPLVDAMDSVRSASAQQVFNDARALQDSGDLEGALASYGSVLEIDPNHAQAHVNLIVVNGQLQRHEDVARHYERAVELNPSIAEAHYNYGVSRHLAADYPGAAAAFRKALSINPQDANAHNNLATALEQSEQHAEAARHYRLAIEHDPSHPQANYHLGRRLAESGRYREALPLLHKALERENQGAPLQAYLLAVIYRELADAARAQQYARLALTKARAGGHGEVAARVASEFGL